MRDVLRGAGQIWLEHCKIQRYHRVGIGAYVDMEFARISTIAAGLMIVTGTFIVAAVRVLVGA